MRLRSGIPVHHGACWIEHINRVVGDPFGQHSKSPLAFLQLGDARSKLLCPVRRALLEVAVQLLELFFRILPSGHFTKTGLVETCVIDRYRSLCGQSQEEPLGARAEHGRLSMSEEQTAEHLSATRQNRDSEIAAHGKMARRHSPIWLHLAVARVREYVGRADGTSTSKRRLKDLRVAGHGKLGESFSRRAGKRAEGIGFP